MRALLPRPVTDVDLLEWYGQDWLQPGGVRVNFITSPDGAASVDGRSAGLQVPGDSAVFRALRTLADVVVAGSGTVIGEQYKPVQLSAERRKQRRDLAVNPELPIAVISRSLNLDPAATVFTGGDQLPRTIVLTCAAAEPQRRRALAEVADVVDCGDTDIDPVRLRGALAARGLTRILCEGGPSVFADLAGRDGIDELCLTVSPRLAGPGAGRITAGRPWDHAVDLELSGVLEDDGALFLRYRRPNG